MEKKKLPANYVVFAISCFIVFIGYACYFNSFGTVAGNMMNFFGITTTQQGFIFTVQAIGGLIMTVLVALFGERFNKIRTLSIGYFLLALSAISIGTMTLYTPQGSGYNLLLCFVFVAGLGVAITDILMSSIISDIFPSPQRSIALSFVHGFYGLGTMAIPFIISSTINPQIASDFSGPYLIIGICAVAAIVFFTIFGEKIRPTTVYADMSKIRKEKQNPVEIFKYGKAWLIFLSSFTYFSFQLGITTWLPTYCSAELGFSSQLSGLMATVFFGGALVMRFLVPLFLKKMSLTTFYTISAVTSTVCMIACFLSSSMWAVIIFAVIGGFLQGGTATMLFMYSCESFPTRTASASSIVVLAVFTGSLLSPLFMGRIAEVLSFRVSLLVITGCLLLSGLLMFIVGLGDKKKARTQS